VYEAEWKNGVEVKRTGKFEFTDGLEYEKEKWDYCTVQDRRFNAEIIGEGVQAAKKLQYVNHPPECRLPIDCYDCGYGVYDPQEEKIFSYDEEEYEEVANEDGEKVQQKTGRMKMIKEDLEPEEIKWIIEKCRKGIL